MEIFIKDEAFIFDRKPVGNYDASITVYTQKLGVENIFIQNAYIVKNIPYVYLDKFSYIRAIFSKLREEKIYIHEIDTVKTFGMDVSKNIDKLVMLSKISSLIYTYSPYPDKRIFNLYKKILYFSLQSNEMSKYYLAFLVKFNYLLGIYNPSIIPKKHIDILNSLLKTKVSHLDNVDIKTIQITEISERLTDNIRRWLS